MMKVFQGNIKRDTIKMVVKRHIPDSSVVAPSGDTIVFIAEVETPASDLALSVLESITSLDSSLVANDTMTSLVEVSSNVITPPVHKDAKYYSDMIKLIHSDHEAPSMITEAKVQPPFYKYDSQSKDAMFILMVALTTIFVYKRCIGIIAMIKEIRKVSQNHFFA